MSFDFSDSPFELQGYRPSPFAMTPFEQDYGQVSLLPNLGSSSSSAYHYTPTFPFPLRHLDVQMPPYQYQPYLPTVNYIPFPTQEFMNQDTTQQVAPLAAPEFANGQFAPPVMHGVFENTTTKAPKSIRGVIRGSSRRQRKTTPYARPSTSTSSSQTSSQVSTPASEFRSLSIIAQRRLAVRSVCKIQSCGQTFTSAEEYEDHVRTFHEVKKGKHGCQLLPCPWDGCTEFKTAGTLWTHIVGHNLKRACPICDKDFKGDRRDSVKRHVQKCKAQTGDSAEVSDGYLYFDEES